MLGVSLLSAVALSACNQSAPETQGPVVIPPPDGNALTVVSVYITGYAFTPQAVEITGSGGALVTWTNSDSVAHIVRSDDDLFDSDFLARGESFSYEFHEKGTFPYHCSAHPFMTGKVIISAAP